MRLLIFSLRLKVKKIVARRSVSSHFLNYFDFLENRNGELWGYSLFSDVFYQAILNAIENQDFKGPVIFLGNHPLIYPVFNVLARFGFEEFVFLQLTDEPFDKNLLAEMNKGFWGLKFSSVDSTAFIQSQKEYSMCFVLDQCYSQQILDDMSYFHFLSQRSLVFDLVGNSNFMFKEVKALGVGVVTFRAN